MSRCWPRTTKRGGGARAVTAIDFDITDNDKQEEEYGNKNDNKNNN
jgi:hypothetical protein